MSDIKAEKPFQNNKKWDSQQHFTQRHLFPEIRKSSVPRIVPEFWLVKICLNCHKLTNGNKEKKGPAW